jgi:AcrR family transcriptional regulator
MPLPRFHKLPPAEQRRILDAATAEFARGGYEGASLNHLLAGLEMSKGALYYYFSDRDDLYAAVVERAILAFSGELAGTFAPRSAAEFWPAIEALAVRGFEYIRKHPKETQALRSFQQDLRRHQKPAFEKALGMVRSNFRVLVRRGIELGCVRTDIGEDLLVELLDAVDAVVDARLFAEDHLGGRAAAKKYAALSIDLGRRIAAPEHAPKKRGKR